MTRGVYHTYEFKHLPSIAQTNHWHDMYAAEKVRADKEEALRKQLEAENESLRAILYSSELVYDSPLGLPSRDAEPLPQDHTPCQQLRQACVGPLQTPQADN